MLSRLFIAALWSPAGKGLTSWLVDVMFNCVFVTFLCGILGQVWYLIASIPDLYRLSFFKPRPRLYVTLAVGGTLNTNIHTQMNCCILKIRLREPKKPIVDRKSPKQMYSCIFKAIETLILVIKKSFKKR